MRKKIILPLLAAALALVCVLASAEAADALRGALEDGAYVVRIPVGPDEPGEWRAESPEGDAAVRLAASGTEDGVFTARYEPATDGDAAVEIRHYDGAACDRVHGFNLRVEDGRMTEPVGGSYTESPAEDELDPSLSGEWLERDTQYTSLFIEKNPDRGWDAEVISPVSHGAYVLAMTLFYDCAENALVYEDGRLFSAPITDSEEADLGEPLAAGLAGALTLSADGDRLALTWSASSNSEERDIVFVPADE